MGVRILIAFVLSGYAHATAQTTGNTGCPCIEKNVPFTECPSKISDTCMCNFAPNGNNGNLYFNAQMGMTFETTYGDCCGCTPENNNKYCANDDGVVYAEECTGNETAGDDECRASWCDDPWCYVDPCNCDADDIVRSTFFGNDYPLFYSYHTCPSSDGSAYVVMQTVQGVSSSMDAECPQNASDVIADPDNMCPTTQAPTDAPIATDAPTDAPTATDAPTDGPTDAPGGATTTTAEALGETVSGSVSMAVANADAIVNDDALATKFSTGVANTLSAITGIAASNIVVTLTAARRLQSLKGVSRRLQSTSITAAYVISVPAGSGASAVTGASVASAISAVSTADLAGKLTTNLAASMGDDAVTISAEGMTRAAPVAVAVTAAPTPAPTPTPAPGAEATTTLAEEQDGAQGKTVLALPLLASVIFAASLF